MNITQTKIAIAAARKIGRTANIIGLHGTGKSEVVKQVAKELGCHYKEFRTGQAADASDLTGLPQFKFDDKNREFTHFVLPDWFPREENTLIFFDEINRGAKDILNGAFEAVYDLSMKGIPMPKGCFIVSACNPPTDDYSGTIDFNDSAFQDRFIHIKFQPTEQEFYTYMQGKFPNSAALAFVQEDQKCLEDASLQSFQLDFVKPSRRSWEAVMKLEEIYDRGELDDNVFHEMVMGIVGLHATPAFMTYKKTHVGSIKADEAIDNYGKVKSAVLKTKAKGRSDILGNLITSVGEELVKRKSLTLQQAQNLIELTADLTPEQAYTLCTLFTSIGHETCSNVDGMPGGLLDNDDLVEVMTKTQKLREEAGKQLEEVKTSGAKKAKKKV